MPKKTPPPDPPDRPKSLLTCEDALDWAFTLLIAGPPLSLRPAVQVSAYYQEQLARCEDERWSDDQLDCLRAARDRDGVAHCGVAPELTCADVVEHRVRLMMSKDEVQSAPPAAQAEARELIEPQRAGWEQRCVAERWSRARRACSVEATSLAEMDDCGDVPGAFE
jgi:hypothetical protein